MIYRLTTFLAISVLLVACQEEYVPKPKGYPRIDLPEAAYKPLSLPLPYYFEQSVHANAHRDSGRLSEPNWITLTYPRFEATIQFTYKPLRAHDPNLNAYIEDARKLTNKHQVRATAIDETHKITGTGNRAVVFRLEGQVPTQYQFFVTDSVHHYLRAAVYFRTSTGNDSLKPVIDFIAADMDHLLKTLKWTR